MIHTRLIFLLLPITCTHVYAQPHQMIHSIFQGHADSVGATLFYNQITLYTGSLDKNMVQGTWQHAH